MKKIVIFLPLLLLLFANGSKAQTWEWATKLEGIALGNDTVVVKAVDTDNNGNTYVTGYYTGQLSASTTSDQQDGFIAKFDGTGTLVWLYKFGGPGNDAGNAISVETAATTPGFYITGYVQYNDPANVTFNGSGAPVDLPSVTSCASSPVPHNVFLRGGLSPKQPFVAKYNLNGALQWLKPIYSPSCLDAQGLGISAAWRHGTGENYEKTVYVTGYFEGNSISFMTGSCTFTTVTGNTNAKTAFVAKLNTGGNASWARSMAVPSNVNAMSVGKSVVVDFVPPSSANILITGDYKATVTFTGTTLTSTTSAVYVTSLTHNGACNWATTIESSGGGASIEARDVACRPGISNPEVLAYGDFEGSTVSGGSWTSPTGGGRDLYMAVLDKTSGAVTYLRADGGINDQFAYGMDLNRNASLAISPDIYISGAFKTGISFVSGSTFSSIGSTLSDHFMARYSMGWGYDCATHWDAQMNQHTHTLDACDIAANKTSGIKSAYLGGFFQSAESPAFTPISPLTTSEPGTGYVSKWVCCECPPPTLSVNRISATLAVASFTFPPCANPNGVILYYQQLPGPLMNAPVPWGTPSISVSAGLVGGNYTWFVQNSCSAISNTVSARPMSVPNVSQDPNLQFDVYPNPTQQTLYFEANQEGTVEIYSLLGTLVKTKSISGSKTEIDVSGLPEGNYVCKFTNQNKVVVTKKIQVMH
jgi:hypothetical protein